ncbi:ABC transporter substrate-binding protein [Ruminococcus flavefaciens]|uniref:ABC transporter substrate-binding protein n=1 Tax=Ruminococcus flavefaciens TaxID=1265 RepID=UPI0026E9CA55|nr:extracellular solute-binding protein [Ruminococcus flavefaciens]
MKKSITTRITALTAALALIAGSAASCGKKEDANNGKVKTAQELMAASYKAVEIDTDVDRISNIDKIDENRVLISTYSDDSSVPTFYISDNEFKDFTPINIDFNVKKEDEVYFNTAVSPDGDIVAIATFTDYGDQEKPNFEDPDFDYEKFDFEEFYSHVKYDYKMYTVDLEGNIKSENDVKGLDEYVDEDGNVSIGSMYPCGSGKVICEIYGVENSYVVLDADGKVSGELEGLDTNYIESITLIDAETIAAAGYFKNYDTAVKYVDVNTLKQKGDTVDIKKAGLSDELGKLFPGSGDYKFLMSTSAALCGIKEDGSGEEIINWLDSDLGNGGVSSIIAMENGDYVIAYQSYESEGYRAGCTLYRLTKRDVSEMENTKVITIGVMYDNYDVKSKVQAFNKSHEGVRFKMVNYSKYDDYDEEAERYISSGEEQLKKDIVSGNAPDMIVCQNQAIIKNLANKGLFVDLGEYLSKDSDIKTDDIMPNVLEACKIGGKTLSLPTAFQIQTYAIKAKNFDKDTWTVDEMIDTYKKMPEGTSLTYLDSKETISEMLLSSICGCIDYEKRTCSFDSPEFKRFLDFADEFPKEDELIDWEDQKAVDEMFNNDNFMKDKQLIDNVYLYDFESYISQYKGRFGDEDVKFIGGPSVGGNGGVLQLSESLAILTNSTDKDTCWELIKEFFKTPEEDDDKVGMNRYYIGGFPTIKSKFEKMADDATKKPYYIDENGKKVEYNYSYYDQSKNKAVDVDPLTEDEKKKIVDYIMNTTTIVDNFDPEIQNIIMEEAEAFFEGEKKSDEVISNLQNRISILLSEQG